LSVVTIGIDDEFESIDKSSVKFKSKLKTQTDVNPKIEAISKNDQNNQNQHLQNKQFELEKRLIYLETQRQIEAKMNEKMFNELTSTTKGLNCTTKRNNSKIIEQQAAIEDLIEVANMFSKKIKHCEGHHK
jgi:hypothetical protein